ncbi:MAG: DMT family transporter [Pseudomonadota bacterium]
MNVISAERPAYGASMIVGGMMLIGVVDNFVRVAAEDIGLWQFHAIRATLAIPLIFAAAALFRRRLRPARWRGPILRTALVVASMLLYFGSLPLAPIAQVGAGLFTSPIWVLVFSVALFREPVGPRRVGAVAIGFIGALVILRPWDAAFTGWSLLPIAAGAFYAMGMIVTRRMCADEPPLALNLMFFSGLGAAGLIGLVVLSAFPAPELAAEAPFFFTGWVWPMATASWGVVAMQAASSVVAVLMLTIGYQSAETTQMTLFEYSFLISASLAGYVIWGERLDAVSFIGIALVVAAGAFIAIRGGAAART